MVAATDAVRSELSSGDPNPNLEVMEGRHDGMHELSFGLEKLPDGFEKVLGT